MKQQIIELKKKLLLVELPEGAINVKGFDYKLIGKLTNITEEQFEEWSGSYEWEDAPEGSKYAYKDYKYGKETDDYWDMYPFDTAKESFFSKLEAEGIYFENKMLEPGSAPIYTHSEKYIEDYKEACRKVWSLDNCYVFEII